MPNLSFKLHFCQVHFLGFLLVSLIYSGDETCYVIYVSNTAYSDLISVSNGSILWLTRTRNTSQFLLEIQLVRRCSLLASTMLIDAYSLHHNEMEKLSLQSIDNNRFSLIEKKLCLSQQSLFTTCDGKLRTLSPLRNLCQTAYKKMVGNRRHRCK